MAVVHDRHSAIARDSATTITIASPTKATSVQDSTQGVMSFCSVAEGNPSGMRRLVSSREIISASNTATTPGSARAADRSRRVILAWACGLRRKAACSGSGMRMSSR
ncbi:MAG: hypothetical protein NTW37_11735 [Proteobacteria bacterium]|nr:hypothetical protein [Pseudomonadota bacterium]